MDDLFLTPPYVPQGDQHLPVVPQIQVTRNCNLACGYCFQDHSGGIIGLSTVETILRRVIAHNLAVDPFNKTIQVYWHGGEPLLAGLDFYRAVIRLEAQYPELSFQNRIQTNGTLMTEEMARFLADHHFQVGFSIDGPQDIHDLYRRFRGSRAATYEAARRGLECYRGHAGVDRVAVIAVVTRASIHRAAELFEFFKQLRAVVQLDIYDVRWLDLLQEGGRVAGWSDFAPRPDEVGRFLIELFDLWFWDQDGLVDFNELRQEVKLALQPEINLGDPYDKKRCDFRRLIFAPDGLVFSCDQWVNDAQTALGEIHRDSLETILTNKEVLWEKMKQRLRRSGKHMACGGCEWGRQCGGGCFSCMKYNAMLLRARAAGLPDDRWVDAVLPPVWEEIRGETYFCEGLRAFRRHLQEAVRRELADVG
ncbi:MAG: radical SAM protein [Deltaproteobacteria bacterium]|nr:radical SAM protein [Deltaproteobacteria bacterium]